MAERAEGLSGGSKDHGGNRRLIARTEGSAKGGRRLLKGRGRVGEGAEGSGGIEARAQARAWALPRMSRPISKWVRATRGPPPRNRRGRPGCKSAIGNARHIQCKRDDLESEIAVSKRPTRIPDQIGASSMGQTGAHPFRIGFCISNWLLHFETGFACRNGFCIPEWVCIPERTLHPRTGSAKLIGDSLGDFG